MSRSCSTCKQDKNKTWLGNSTVLGTLLVIIIPKCPLCIMAYTSAITMCGGADMYFTENNWVSYIPLVLSFIVTLLIFFNRKGKVTYAALTLSLTATVLIVLTHQLIIPEFWYNAGTALLILAIWMNGSFSSFVKTVKQFLS
ncbi:MAG: hypothetical protein P8X57_14180, partial [Cyclobacteriaceae bacterium]